MKYLKKKSEIIEKVKIEVNKLLEGDTSGHSMEHIERVFNMSLRFAKREKADEFVVSLIALLHDIDDYKLFGEENADNLFNARTIMSKLDIDNEIQVKVLDAIRAIGYKKLLNGIRPSL